MSSVATASTAAASPTITVRPAGYDFLDFGTVKVTGNVAEPVNFSIYRVDNAACTGTVYPGPDNSCTPQTQIGTLIIPVGDYTGQTFTVTPAATCGPVQEDLYTGPDQPTVDLPGTKNLIKGLLVQLPTACTTAPTSTAPTTTAPTSAAPTTTAPTAPGTSSGVLGVSTTRASSSPSVTTTISGSDSQSVDAISATDPSSSSSDAELASTGANHVSVMISAALAAILAGAAFLLIAGRSGTRRQH